MSLKPSSRIFSLHGKTSTRAMGQGAAVCLDITRLVSRAGRQLTGVDRVEAAYLDHLLDQPQACFGLCQTRFGVLILDRDGLRHVRPALNQTVPWGPIDLVGRLRRRARKLPMRAEADLRKVSIRRGRDPGRVLSKLGSRVIYINVGQTSLNAGCLRSLSRAGIPVWAMLHDAIPVAHPAWHRPVVVARFKATLAAVSRYADRVIYNSTVTQLDVSPRLAEMGRCPPTVVAHLGVDHLKSQHPTQADTNRYPRPYCLCVGTLDARKNQQFLLEIWDSWTDPIRPDLILCGQLGDGANALASWLQQPPPGVVWKTGLGDAQILTLTQGAVCALFPSQAEGFGFPPAEAISLGTPAICAPLPVYDEILGDNVVYAALGDAYQWKKEIINLAQRGATPARGKQRLPTWKDHFNIVLNDA